MTKTIKDILVAIPTKVDGNSRRWINQDEVDKLNQEVIDQALKEIEAIMSASKPYSEDSLDIEAPGGAEFVHEFYQGAHMGIERYEANLRQALYGKDEK